MWWQSQAGLLQPLAAAVLLGLPPWLRPQPLVRPGFPPTSALFVPGSRSKQHAFNIDLQDLERRYRDLQRQVQSARLCTMGGT